MAATRGVAEPCSCAAEQAGAGARRRSAQRPTAPPIGGRAEECAGRHLAGGLARCRRRRAARERVQQALQLALVGVEVARVFASGSFAVGFRRFDVVGAAARRLAAVAARQCASLRAAGHQQHRRVFRGADLGAGSGGAPGRCAARRSARPALRRSARSPECAALAAGGALAAAAAAAARACAAPPSRPTGGCPRAWTVRPRPSCRWPRSAGS